MTLKESFQTTTPAAPAGPFETERQAYAASLYATHGRDQGIDINTANVADLAAGLSGVELGAHDRRIVEWLAGFEPSTVAVVCGLLSRVRQAAAGPCENRICLDAAQLDVTLDALDEAAEGRHVAAGRECSDCDTAPDGLCDDHAADIERSCQFDAVGRQLRQEAGR